MHRAVMDWESTAGVTLTDMPIRKLTRFFPTQGTAPQSAPGGMTDPQPPKNVCQLLVCNP